ncbi:MAG: hypothetical protein ABSD70_10010 [Terracidiphilus sp.]
MPALPILRFYRQAPLCGDCALLIIGCLDPCGTIHNRAGCICALDERGEWKYDNFRG